MSGLIKAVIVFVLSNYFLTFLVIGLLFSAVAIARAKRPVKPAGRRGATRQILVLNSP